MARTLAQPWLLHVIHVVTRATGPVLHKAACEHPSYRSYTIMLDQGFPTTTMIYKMPCIHIGKSVMTSIVTATMY